MQSQVWHFSEEKHTEKGMAVRSPVKMQTTQLQRTMMDPQKHCTEKTVPYALTNESLKEA
jgi:hypothetical protein